MYKTIGPDGKEHGPYNLQEMRQWISEGRINGQTLVQGPGSSEWRPASTFPEFGLSAAPGSPPSPPPPPSEPRTPPQSGLAITSLVLGILSLACLGLLAGIPAIICGHKARGRARRAPAQYGGAGLALAGLIMGYVSLAVTLVVLPAMLLPALAKAKERAQRIHCVSNMKLIGISFRLWAGDHDDHFPFNVSTNSGGTMELCQPDSDGFDRNAAYHFRALSNELNTTRILVCPADKDKQPAQDFESLEAANLSYKLRTGKDLTEANPEEILVVCPIHNNILYCDGSVVAGQKRPR
ncbi:MAG: DUF4339 domain-containing protein [Verrucomicrobia bacterium]|jgi:hypothetical protein|nr:DUF4339 domain-containing protein [Verrucomicrobiota bacterium]OQC68213.1 MAG: hypothetical protein BWX48_00154 [Verrucomicrobia bacterium ADurb.Bin006]NMD18699.1 DUF4190 domain-containing protein [Verrucomicrobiota bacterium]HOA63151.1 DUF4190 domain-containing protein [Verrucomicrobiota bacterium]HOF49960.1 DUF4190 domain-containing protein [Verrucomicrobiota bacterium]